MNPLDCLSQYLARVERRLRWLTLARGAAVSAAAALLLTLAGAVGANWYAFTPASVLAARVALFLGLALALSAAVIVPLLQLNRRRAAREAERRFPAFEQRLLTFSERACGAAHDPFLSLLAGDTLPVADAAPPASVASDGWIVGLSSAAAVAAGLLVWLVLAGPGFLGYGSALLWAGYPKGESRPYYEIRVEPGNRTIRRHSDQVVTARLRGFQPPEVRLLARFQGGVKWDAVPMRAVEGRYEFVFAAIPESLEYYVEAGTVQSGTFRFNVVDLPRVKKIRVTYHYPAWTGMPDAVEDPGGDLRAVEGTTAEVAIETDRPLHSGVLLLDDGSKLPLREGQAGTRVASVLIQRDGLYHIAALEHGDNVRLSEDYFIEARKDRPPEVRITRPGRDARVNPIEEVAVQVHATDDFGLHAVELHYSVNGGAEKTVPLSAAKGAKEATGSTTIYLEDFKLVPGDVVSLWATARDARASTGTDMIFVEAQPFEREYQQSQQSGGGGGGAGDEEGNRISQRQKEIIAATWNQIRGGEPARAAAAENAAFLAQVQSKLRDQARSLANRMRSRELSGAGEAFQSFVTDMEKAAEFMEPAAEKLKGLRWQDALAPEQKALQHLLRAEATFRNIQVAFGSRGGGGGGRGGATRDLEGLFDLELDTEKNQYESGSRQSAAEQRQKEIDEALQKLEQLARRQQEMARQPRNRQQVSEQRWQQEKLRREAEELQRQLEQLSRESSSQLSRNQQSGQQSGQQGQPSGRQSSQRGAQGGRESAQLRQTIERLQQATRDMRQAGTPQAAGSPQGEAEARRAAEHLKEASELLGRLRKQQSEGQVDELARRGEELAGRQQDFDNRLRRAFGNPGILEQPGTAAPREVAPQQAEQLAGEKQRLLDDLQKLEADMQKAVRDLAGTEVKASGKMREALGTMQQQELPMRMRWSAEALRRGLGAYAAMREPLTTQAMRELSRQLGEARQAMGTSKPGEARGRELEQALSRVERLRQQLEEAGRQGRDGSRGNPSAKDSRNVQGRQQGEGGQQPGDSPEGQEGRRAGGSQPGGLGNQRGQGMDRPGEADRRGGAGSWARGGPAINRGDWQPPEGGAGQGGDTVRAYGDALRQLGELERASRGDAPFYGEVRELLRGMQRLDPRLFSSAVLDGRIREQLLGEIQQVEMRLRRLSDEQQAGSVRSRAAEPAAPGYGDAVAEYFRRLSKAK